LRSASPAPASQTSAEPTGTTTAPAIPARIEKWITLRVGDCLAGPPPVDPAAVEIHTGSGEVAVQGIADAVLVETGSGDVVLRDLAGDVDAITGSGDVVLDGMSGAVIQADTGSGDVELFCEVRPTRVEVSTGSGDVDVVVPSGVYHVATDTGSGDVALHGVTADRGADAVIDVSTGSGDIQLTGR
jgi:DUF4097 and DUF4098 domain-containing protein YvlB